MKRNLVKRTLSLVLSVSVLFSMMIFSSSVSANTATPIFSEDFTTWTAENLPKSLQQAAGLVKTTVRHLVQTQILRQTTTVIQPQIML